MFSFATSAVECVLVSDMAAGKTLKTLHTVVRQNVDFQIDDDQNVDFQTGDRQNVDFQTDDRQNADFQILDIKMSTSLAIL
jgi:hypothetical protein